MIWTFVIAKECASLPVCCYIMSRMKKTAFIAWYICLEHKTGEECMIRLVPKLLFS